jgi:hypothetical protein
MLQTTFLTKPRRAVILMVVLVLLTLFAIVGLTFVLYADSESKIAQIAREAESQQTSQFNSNSYALLNFAMSQLLFDQDNKTGVYSAARGHSFGRSMYGYNDMPGAANFLPFNGTGRLYGTTIATDIPKLAGANDYNLVNYTYYPGDGGVFDPERTRARTDPTQPYPANSIFFGSNPPYTAPDLNNMYLATVRPDGTVLLPSFHRPWTGFGPIFDPANPTKPNPNWFVLDSANPVLKHLVMRPRPVDQLLTGETWDPVNNQPVPARPFFGAPADPGGPTWPGGDVKNLVGAPGGNDSIWLDLGAPVQTLPDGITKYKALFAPLIVDLDNRVNLNVHGNILALNRGQGGPTAHLSNQGWGPWTVNLGQVLTLPPNTTAGQPPTEWTSLFLGNSAATPPAAGRYGQDGYPGTGGPTNVAATNGLLAHFYDHFDFDGCDDSGNATPAFPAAATGPFGAAGSSFPTYPVSNGAYGDAIPPPPLPPPNSKELLNHPSIYNAFTPAGDDRVFPLSNLEGLLRFGDGGANGTASDLYRLCPTNFNDPRVRRMVTLRSFDVDSPGVAPWLWNAQANAPYGLAPGALFPQGNALSFPTPYNAAVLTAPSDFGSVAGATPTPDYRSLIASLGRVDLNRSLPPYPAATGASGSITNIPGFLAAQNARQLLAQDIFAALLGSTTGLPVASLPNTLPSPPFSDPTYNSYRWLAQLAVNIVDFIDTDDYMTPFFWNPNLPNEVVMGTELPRIVINEAYAEWTKQGTVNSPTNVQVWVELHNTFNNDNSLTSMGELATNAIPNVYQLLLCQPDPAPAGYPPTNASPYYRRADNVWGTPYKVTATDTSMVYPVTIGGADAVVNTWGAAGTTVIVPPSNGGAGPNGFFLVGPGPLTGGTPNPDYVSPSMAYQVPCLVANQAPPAPTVMLQRLACPYLQPNPPSGSTTIDVTKPYNPFVTVDYMQNVNAQSSTMANPGLILPANEHAAVLGTPGVAASEGRVHPYYGYYTQTAPTPPVQRQPQAAGTTVKNSFQQVNSQLGVPAGSPLDWLVHLDRQLTSPMELMHVSAFKPHELTQTFVVPSTDPNPAAFAVQPFNHRVPWFDEDLAGTPTASHRLYRFFEFVETASRAAGTGPAITTSPNAIPAPGASMTPTPTVVTPAQMNGFSPTTGMALAIKPNQVLIVDPGLPTQESVRVISTTATTFTAGFFQGHAAGCAIVLPSTGNRVPGKINVCSLFDPPYTNPNDPVTFSALCDAQSSNNFTGQTPGAAAAANDVDSIYKALLGVRSPGDPGAAPPIIAGFPSSKDLPFWGLAPGLYPANDPQYSTPLGGGPGYNINNGLLRSVAANGTGTSMRLFQVPFNDPNGYAPSPTGTTPWVKYQLLNKIFNETTTRSNVFAIYLTVGFFQVIQDTDPITMLPVLPVKLGAEIGISDNTNVRPRMFAIVDRTNFKVPTQITTIPNAIKAGQQTVPVASVSGLVPPVATPQVQQFTWSIQPGQVLVIDAGTTNQETVTVTQVNATPPSFTAGFGAPHSAGATVSVAVLPGNPGPQVNFDLRDPLYAPLVPYFNIIN